MRPMLLGLVVFATAASAMAKEGSHQVLIPAGSYVRGLEELNKAKQRIITLHSYRIDQEETTNQEYDACVKAKKCSKASAQGDPDWPVAGVTWKDADAYCKFVGRRLPTEAEWERAAFPPDKNQDGKGPLIASKYDYCTVLVVGGIHRDRCKNRQRYKHPVTITIKNSDAEINYRPDQSTVGGEQIFDLFGNVAEWVADWDSGFLDYRKAPTLSDPRGPDSGDEKVVRGGSFIALDGVSQMERRSAPPNKRSPDVGFRCASDAK